jgi:hypothetical protein
VDVPVVNADEVVAGTHGHEVLALVPATPRAVGHVVDVVRRPAAARDLAEAAVPHEHLLLGRAPLGKRRRPYLEEMARHPFEALAGGDPVPRGLAGSPVGGDEEEDHPARHPEVELAPRTHLRLLPRLDLLLQGDAGRLLRPLDPAVH